MEARWEVMRNHASDLITQDLIIGGFYKYGDMSQYGVSYKYPYARYEHRTGNILWSEAHIKELQELDMPDETAERLIVDLKNDLEGYRKFVASFGVEKPNAITAARKAVEEWFTVTQRVIPTVSYFAFEESFTKRLEREGYTLTDVASSCTEVTKASEKVAQLRVQYTAEFESGGPVSDQLFKELAEIADEYGYLGMKYFSGEPWTAHTAYQMALHSSADGLHTEASGKKEPETKTLYYLGELTRLRTVKWELMCKSVYKLRTYIEEHFRGVIQFQDLLHCTIDEVIQLVNGDFSVMLHKNEDFTVQIDESGYHIDCYPKDSSPKTREENLPVDEIKGTAAYKGVITGPVKVVHSPSEAGKVEKGDVLIATMSTPDFLPAMQKAAAFVTDIGGITSHAAIVAREMKKPCIIGTKVATKVLKDGDEVEVDAERGVVLIIE